MPEQKNNNNKTPGSDYKYAALLSAPTMLITFPLVGFGLGWLLVRYLHWPAWVEIVTLLMGLVEGMREVYSLGMRIEKDEHK